MTVNAVSVGGVEYYHGMELEAAVPADERESLPSRVEHHRFRHYVNLACGQEKIDSPLYQFWFAPVRDVLELNGHGPARGLPEHDVFSWNRFATAH